MNEVKSPQAPQIDIERLDPDVAQRIASAAYAAKLLGNPAIYSEQVAHPTDEPQIPASLIRRPSTKPTKPKVETRLGFTGHEPEYHHLTH